jgi:hypothetical protein
LPRQEVQVPYRFLLLSVVLALEGAELLDLES